MKTINVENSHKTLKLLIWKYVSKSTKIKFSCFLEIFYWKFPSSKLRMTSLSRLWSHVRRFLQVYPENFMRCLQIFVNWGKACSFVQNHLRYLSMMRAVRVAQFGDPSVLKVAEVPKVSPEKNEVLIKVAAAGINPGRFYHTVKTGN